MELLDTVIIGGGPAGMTAAIYAKRKGMSLALIAESMGGNMSKSGNLENYPGYEAISGTRLTGKMKEQLQRLGVEGITDRVAVVEKTPEGYRIRTEGRRSFETRSIIVATGSHWREIGVPGEREFVNRGVSFCSTCDAPLFMGMDVAVVGGGNSAAESVLDLSHIAAKVYMIIRSRLKADQILAEQLRNNAKVTLMEGYGVVSITGKDFVEAIGLKSAETGETITLNVGGVFVEIGLDPNTGLIKNLLKINDRGEIIVDDHCRTSEPGIFACGDVTSVPDKQVIVAAGEGAKAAMSAYTYVTTLKST